MKAIVVIPNWNGKDFISECLDSLTIQTYKDFEIIVVDNGSTDGSKELIKQKYPEVSLIELDKNYGFAGGVNAGIKKALAGGAKYIVLFNNDAVADKNWLKRLIEVVETNPLAGIITSKLLRLDKKTIDSAGEFYSIWGRAFPLGGRDEIDHGQYDGVNQCLVFCGIRRS